MIDHPAQFSLWNSAIDLDRIPMLLVHVVVIDQGVDDGFFSGFDRGGEKWVHQIIGHCFDCPGRR